MARKHFLLLILFMQMVFNFIPYDPAAQKYDLFLWSDVRVTPEEYVYHLFAHLSILYLCLLIRIDARKPDIWISKKFFEVNVFDFFDFLGGFNTPYFMINYADGWAIYRPQPYPIENPGVPFSGNIVMIGLFIYFMLIEPARD